MKLKDFIQDIGAVETRGPLDIDITAITSDSRAVTPGSLFIAVKGFASDGHKYIASAIEKGAVAIVCEEIPDQVRNDDNVMADSDRPSATFLKVENSRHAVAMIADAFYGHPSRKLTLVGITGTNGKTTTAGWRPRTPPPTRSPSTASSRRWSTRAAATASWKSAPSAWSRSASPA